jgi:hypothetical protein
MNCWRKQATWFVLIVLGVCAASVCAEERLEMADPPAVLKAFMNRMAQGKIEKAYELVAPSSKKNGDPIAYQTPLDLASFRRELEGIGYSDGEFPFPKFANYRVGKQRQQTKDIFRIFIHMGGDNDEAMIVREQGRWYIADPVHIIR